MPCQLVRVAFPGLFGKPAQGGLGLVEVAARIGHGEVPQRLARYTLTDPLQGLALAGRSLLILRGHPDFRPGEEAEETTGVA